MRITQKIIYYLSLQSFIQQNLTIVHRYKIPKSIIYHLSFIILSLSPEIVAEQVMGYVVGASELIPTLKPSQKNPYSVAMLPQGPHFYTGLLQAAGYLLLDSKKKKFLIISQQSDDTKHILVDANEYSPTFGQVWKNSTKKITSFTHDIGAQIGQAEQKSLSEQMRFQLPFLRIITEAKELWHISIGEKTPQSTLNKTYARIKKNIQEYNIIFLTNIELDKPATSKKIDEQNKIAKTIQAVSQKTPLITVFQKTLSFHRKKPEIIAYVNPSDFGKPTSLTTRYVCAVG